MVHKNSNNNLIHKIATFIVDKRYLFFLLYLFALVFSLFSRNWVEIETDITQYLPEDTETRQGIVAMNENFATFATARVMVSNVTYDTALELCREIQQVPGIQLVNFDDTGDHYQDAAALFDLSFSGGNKDEETVMAMQEVNEIVKGYDVYIDTMVGVDEMAALDKEMLVILIVAVSIILIVLTLTSRAYAEAPVLLITFGVAALLNMGTNFFYGKISFISNSVAAVLQLALAFDYAIILCHRFSDERKTQGVREACITALAKSIPEISASSLTTVGGLFALSFMKFSIGFDMSMVLIKAIILSLLTVFTLMPGLLVLFSPLIDRTQHRKLLPNITPLGKFAVKTRRVMPFVFAVVLVAAFTFSNQCPYCFGYTDVETTKMTRQQVASQKIRDTFGSANMVALVVPTGDYEAERAVLEELEAYPQVKSTMALSNMEAMDGYYLTESVTPRQFSELVGLDYEVAQALYSAYAIENDQYGEMLNGLSAYDVPLFDMFLFLRDQFRAHNVTFSGPGDGLDLEALFSQLDTAQEQMQSEKYSRMVVFLNTREEGEETFRFLDEIHRILGKYYEGDYYVVGNSTSCRDLSASFASDNLLISILSALFVILVLLFTFRSVGLPILLIIVIQGSIWINFSFPTLMHQPLYFLGYLIVNAIQMGANIDYAIVISSHYQEKKELMPHKKAIIAALNAAFPTVFTSGSILAAAGLLIGNLSTQPVIAIMGTCLGRGTIISMILVLCVLPSVLVLGDSIIERTRFKLKVDRGNVQQARGTMKMRGHVRGYISGMVDAEFDGTLKGDIDAAIVTDGQSGEGDEPDEK